MIRMYLELGWPAVSVFKIWKVISRPIQVVPKIQNRYQTNANDEQVFAIPFLDFEITRVASKSFQS